MSPYLIAAGILALLFGVCILACFLDRHDGREPDSTPAPFFVPDDDRDIREYHNMNRAEWERTPNPAKARLRDAYYRALNL